jgi:hypothetical protein
MILYPIGTQFAFEIWTEFYASLQRWMYAVNYYTSFHGRKLLTKALAVTRSEKMEISK